MMRLVKTGRGLGKIAVMLLLVPLLLWAEDVVKVKLTDTSGNTNFAIQDLDGTAVFRVNSDGQVNLGTWQGTTIKQPYLALGTTAGDGDTLTLHDFLLGGPALNQIPKWNGTNWQPADDEGAAAITNLNGQTGATQTFANDTNVTISSASNQHTLGWNGQLAEARGGTNQSTYTTGDMLYASAANTLAKLPVGSTGQVLTVSGGIPTWGTHGYTLSVQALTSTPGDGGTVYFANLPKTTGTQAASGKVYIRKAGTIKIAEIYSYSGTAGSGEASWSLYIRVNDSTDYLIASLAVATNERIFSNTGLNIAVVAGDYIQIKCTYPTFGTNPATTIYGGYIYIE